MPAVGIVLFAPNPGLDRTIAVDDHRLGHEHRARRTDLRAGGKAINVARALRALGVDAPVVAPVAGPTGDAMLALARAEGLTVDPVPCAGLTRSTLAVLDAGGVTVYNDSGFVPADDEAAALERAVEAALGAGDLLVVAGSWPRGTPPDRLHAVVMAGRRAGARIVVDTSGRPLAAALRAGPDLVCPNLEEARALLAEATGSLTMDSQAPLEAAAPVASAVRHQGSEAVVLSAGRAGAVLADAEGTAAVPAPRVQASNPVGAGDCLVAALVAGCDAGRGLRETLAWAVAVASASCETFAAGDFDVERARELAAVSAA